MATVTNLNGNEVALFLHSAWGAEDLPFHGGWLCLRAPLRRHAALGTGGAAGTCGGLLNEDLDAYVLSGVDPSLVAGATLWLQAWSRDGGDPFGDGLSDAVRATICP